MASLARDLRHVLAVAFTRTESDTELIERFVASRDEAAFAEVVRRHGPVVLRVCRNLLPPTDADDAFQATFFVLARRAESVRSVSSLGGWLVGVAGRVARQLRKAGWRRAAVEGQYTPHDYADRSTNQNLKELDDELTRLPERLRDPVVLCFLEEKTQEEAAATLGQSVRTIRRRLDRAKAVLRLRLERRGVVPVMLVSTSPLVVSSDVAARTAAAAAQFFAGGAYSPAATLAKGIAMSALKWKVAATLTVAAGLFTALGSGVAQDARKPKPVANPLRTDSQSKSIIVPDGGTVLLGGLQSVGATYGEESARGITVSAANPTIARVILHEAEHQLDFLATQWFGKPPEELPFKLRIAVNPTGNPNGSTVMQFGDGDKLVEARMTLSGPLEPMLFDQLPCEIAHVVLVAHFGPKLPRWASHGLASSVMSPDAQAKGDSAVRAVLSSGKAYRLKTLFAMKDFPQANEDCAAYLAQSASVVRFLTQWKLHIRANGPPWDDVAIVKEPKANHDEFIRFVKAGIEKADWDSAAANVLDAKAVELLELAWLEWLKSDLSLRDLPATAKTLIVDSDPARIPAVNLGK